MGLTKLWDVKIFVASTLEISLKIVRDEYKDYQDQKKIEDLLTVKFDVESFNEEMLTKP